MPKGAGGFSNITDEAAFESGKWGKDGQAYVDGYTYIYWGLPGDSPERIEQNTVAIQDKGSGQFFSSKGFKVTIAPPAHVQRDKFLTQVPNLLANDPNGIQDGTDVTSVTAGMLPRLTGLNGNYPPSTGKGVLSLSIEVEAGVVPADAILYVFGRYNSESDFEGNYLGEVEIRMDEYMFKPSPTSIGVSWSQLTEITLDKQHCSLAA